MFEGNLFFLLLIGAFVGAASGYLGSFMVVKRMSLVGDAMSHVALPGMAIALAIGASPILGAFVALTVAVILIWYLEKTSNIYPEGLVGLMFTASLAIGILVTPEPELLEALFGNIENITKVEGIIAIFLSILIVVISYSVSKKLLLGVISEELAKSTGVVSSKINFIYLFLVGLVVALGVKFVGTLLMGALVIIPAVSAKNISGGMKSYGFFSIAFGIVSATVGIFASRWLSFPTGPVVVLTSIAIFLATYIFHLVKSS